MKHLIVFGLSLNLCFGCTHQENTTVSEYEGTSFLTCEEGRCFGAYKGSEFINGSDKAHEFSNGICEIVGDELKELYRDSLYSKVDFSRIKMSTKGMGSGTVVYEVSIPFQRVEQECDAYTSFDHVGGWNHSPALAERKKQLQSALLKGEKLDISDLKTTPEGLQEYWIQWKNKDVQANCVR